MLIILILFIIPFFNYCGLPVVGERVKITKGENERRDKERAGKEVFPRSARGLPVHRL